MMFSRRPPTIHPPLRALVVDDARPVREHVAALMRARCALQVVEAENGVQALKRLQEHTFDLVLTDVDMPLLDGLKLTGLVRRGVTNPKVPILVMTAREDVALQHAALAAGADAFLLNAAADDDVVGQVLQLLGRHDRLAG